MMTSQQKLILMAQVLRKGKALAPDRFPQPNQETVTAWAEALSRLMDSFPLDHLWSEAISVWSMELVGDRMVTPKDLKAAVYVVRDRWEADPAKSEVLQQIRERNVLERDRQLADGTFGQIRGYKPPAPKPLGARKPKDLFRDMWKSVEEK